MFHPLDPADVRVNLELAVAEFLSGPWHEYFVSREVVRRGVVTTVL